MMVTRFRNRFPWIRISAKSEGGAFAWVCVCVFSGVLGHLRVRVGVRERVRVRMRVLRALARLCWGQAKVDVQAVSVCYLLALPS